jgi:hypothetical protein
MLPLPPISPEKDVLPLRDQIQGARALHVPLSRTKHLVVDLYFAPRREIVLAFSGNNGDLDGALSPSEFAALPDALVTASRFVREKMLDDVDILAKLAEGDGFSKAIAGAIAQASEAQRKTLLGAFPELWEAARKGAVLRDSV